MRIVPLLAQSAGAALIITGTAMLSVVAALILAGLFLIAAGALAERAAA